MSFRTLKYLLLPIALFFFCSNTPKDENLKEEVITKTILQNVEYLHFSPKSIDDSLSADIFNLYLQRIDYLKRFLLQEDVDKLKEYQYQIDDLLLKPSNDFFDLSYQILTKRIDEAETYYQEILEKPFDFTIDESIVIDPDNQSFPKTKDELKEVWRKSLKNETLIRLHDAWQIQEKAREDKDTSIEQKDFAELEKEAREKMKERYKSLFYRIKQLEKEDRFSDYVNSFVNVFDPHTSYFPPRDKEDFDIRFSGQLEGIGAVLQQGDEYIKVASVVPGGPAYKQGELKEGHVIMKVAQEGEEPVEIVDMRLDKAVRLIRGPKGTKVTLTVKKIDNSISNITIVRDVVNIEETYAKSSVLESDVSNNKYGYIKLPSFYSDFGDRNGRRCGTDMRKEIEKLKKENIKGIILDLRNNGGGSLSDAVEIAGLFIDKGPIVQVKARLQEPYLHNDTDPQVQWDGPLVVLVNSHSASASEIFAAAMQDYGRAVIVGGNTTFGKGTVQRFVDLDKYLPRIFDDLKPTGSLKITIQKFYRINGGATQLNGVTPDIILPDIFNYIDVGEREMDYGMPWTEINPVAYTKWIYPIDMALLKQKSSERVDSHPIFSLIDENAKRMKTMRDRKEFTLNFEQYKEEQRKLDEESKIFEQIGKDTLDIDVDFLKADKNEIESDSTKTQVFNQWSNEIRTDIYIDEALNIINDLYMLRKD